MSGVLEDLKPVPRRRVILVARLMAKEPDVSRAETARRLGMAERTARKYCQLLEATMDAGRLDLKPYGVDPPVPEKGEKEYNATRSLDMSLKLIVRQKQGLIRDQELGKKVSTQQILQLVDAEKKLLSIPQRAEDVPKDFYDQIFGRIPLLETDDDEDRRHARDFEELGQAGDLLTDELERELGIHGKKENHDEEY